MSKKVFLRRQDLGGHLPKAVRAEAKARAFNKALTFVR